MYTPVILLRDFEAMVQSSGNALLNAIDDAKLVYDKWYQLTYGLSDEQMQNLQRLSMPWEYSMILLRGLLLHQQIEKHTLSHSYKGNLP